MSRLLSLAVEIPQAKVTRGWENIVKQHHYTSFCPVGTLTVGYGQGVTAQVGLCSCLTCLSLQKVFQPRGLHHSNHRDESHWYEHSLHTWALSESQVGIVCQMGRTEATLTSLDKTESLKHWTWIIRLETFTLDISLATGACRAGNSPTIQTGDNYVLISFWEQWNEFLPNTSFT